MPQPAKGQEPSMEEILASIRRIIADDDRGNHTGILLGQRYGGGDLRLVLQAVAAEPDTLDHLQSDLAGKVMPTVTVLQ